MALWSPSSRRAWIEIRNRSMIYSSSLSPSSRRAWIEIRNRSMIYSSSLSPSSRRAWIEILKQKKSRPCYQQSPSSRRAWIEIIIGFTFIVCLLSPSSRRAWIEIMTYGITMPQHFVALLAEGVDRNLYVLFRLYPLSGRPPRGGRG